MDRPDKSIPANVEAEEAVLGSLLIDPDAIIKVASFLKADDFYREKNGWIYQAVLDLHERREPADFVTLVDELERRNQLAEIGGSAYITYLINAVPTAMHVEHYAHIVERAAIMRRLIAAAGQIAALAYEEAEDVDEVVDRAEQIIFGVSERRIRRDLTPVRQIMSKVVDRIEYLHHHKGDILGVPSGFRKLDNLLGGFQKSDLIILAARPSVGKCIVSGSRLLDPATGQLVTIDEIVSSRQGHLITLDEHYRLRPATPSDFVEDGIKPVYRVRTSSGREISTTASHPFLTIDGWRPLLALAVGQRIAVPRALPYFGSKRIPAAQVKVLAYLIADGCLTSTVPQFTNQDQRLREDFAQALVCFPGVGIRTRDSGGRRTPTMNIVGEPEFITANRAQFAANLTAAIRAYPHSMRHLAHKLGVSPALISIWKSGACVPNIDTFDKLCRELDVTPETLAPLGLTAISKNGKNPLTEWLISLGLWGCNAHTKFVPAVIFELERPLVALFLNRLFACDGSIYQGKAANPQISYATVSPTLARDVRHLLLRFGIMAQCRQRRVRYAGTTREVYELVITGRQDILTFLDEIGAFGKEEQAEAVRQRCLERQQRGDTVPIEVWSQILAAKGNMSWRQVYRRLGYSAASNFHASRRAPTRERLQELASTFGDEQLMDLASSDLYWDTIESIEYAGEQQVYDLTVEGTHNFVADDMLVHNTSLALNIAVNAAKRYGQRVAFFSLEMSNEQLVQRLLASETGIDQQRLRRGEIQDEEWLMLMEAAGVLSETLLFIDDTPAMSALELRTKARRLQAEHGLDLVIVDYLQLMRGDVRSENRVQEISYISRSLKSLARELEVPLIALSQLSRAVETRTDHRPVLSDLRECLTGDTWVVRADTGKQVSLAELAALGQPIPVWALDDDLKLKPAWMNRVFPSGIKPVFKLHTRTGRTIRASGNHPFLQIDGWKRLDQLSAGDFIATPRLIPEPQQPQAWPEERLILLAHLIGDGCFVERQPLHYTSQDPACLEAVESAAAAFDVKVKRVQQKSWTHLYLSAQQHLTHGVRNPIAAWLDELGIYGQHFKVKTLPQSLFGLPSGQIALFLRHLWATDGSLRWIESNHRAQIYYATSSPALAEGVHHLLLSLGINARVRLVGQRNGYAPQYAVYVEGKIEQLRFLGRVGAFGRKTAHVPFIINRLAEQQANPNCDVIPKEAWQVVVDPARRRAGLTWRAFAARLEMSYCGSALFKSGISRERMARIAEFLPAPEITRLVHSDVYWDQIESIEPDGEEVVYDGMVPGLHNFVANDFIVHNSGALEQDADVVMFIYREDMVKEDTERKNIADIIVAKHRNGPTDTVPLYFKKELTLFADLETTKEPLEYT